MRINGKLYLGNEKVKHRNEMLFVAMKSVCVLLCALLGSLNRVYVHIYSRQPHVIREIFHNTI